MAKKTILFPFDKFGNLIDYDDLRLDSQLEAFVFEDSLRYDGYRRGRSSMHVTLVSTTTGKKYPCFFSVFDELIRRPDILPGPTFSGKWTFSKKGANYSVVPVGNDG